MESKPIVKLINNILYLYTIGYKNVAAGYILLMTRSMVKRRSIKGTQS